MLTKCTKSFFKRRLHRAFSSIQSSDMSTTDSDEGAQNLKNIIDPNKGQYTDFLKNVGVYEEQNEDTLKAMYYLDNKPL